MKFGAFSELSDSSESEEFSDHLESEDDVITVPEHEDERVPPVTIVAEEHDNLKNVEVQSDFQESENTGGDGENDGEEDGFEGDDSIFGGGFSGSGNFNLPEPHDLDMNFEFGNNYCPSIEELDSFFENINEVAHLATETRDV